MAEGIGKPKYVCDMIITALKAGRRLTRAQDLKLMELDAEMEPALYVKGLRSLLKRAQGHALGSGRCTFIPRPATSERS